MHRAQPRDRGEEAERPAAGGDKEGGIGRRDLADIVARDVGDDEDARLRRIIEGRGDARARPVSPADGAGRSRPRPRARRARDRGTPSVNVAEVTTRPCAGRATHSANGIPGSTQLRVAATSVSSPSMRSSANHSTVSGRAGSARSREQPAPARRAADRRAGRGRAPPRRGVGAGPVRAGSSGFSSRARTIAASRRSAAARRSSPCANGTCRLDETLDRRARLGLRAVAGIGEWPRAPAPAAAPAPESLRTPCEPRPSPTRCAQPSPGSTRAAPRTSISARTPSSSPSTRSPMRRRSPRARDPPAPSAPDDPAPQLARPRGPTGGPKRRCPPPRSR